MITSDNRPRPQVRISQNRLPLRGLLAACLSGGMLLCSSCIGDLPFKTAAGDPFLSTPESRAVPVQTAAVTSAAWSVAAEDAAGSIQQVSHARPSSIGVVRLAEWQPQPAAFAAAPRVNLSIHRTPTTARTDIQTTSYQPPFAMPVPPGALHGFDVTDYEDEYLLDGGDRALPIHYDNFNRLGLDTEDAVVEFSDHLGEHHVQPTNRVAIYSPRFGAVRTVSTPGAGTSVDLFALSTDTSRSAGLRNRRTPLDRTQNDAAGRIRMRSRASGVDSDAARRGVHQATTLVLHAKPIRAAEDLSFVGTGRFLQTERARLATGIQAAAYWSQKESPVIMAQADGLHEAYASFKPEELIGLDVDKKPGELRIVKLADRIAAKPGDVVSFTIRYDNLGDLELREILIIDNLTPRLEYVEDSATSDRAGRLDVEDNQEGSLVLKFVIDDPLPGGEGGVVTFKATVR